jgi:hypothetical protein
MALTEAQEAELIAGSKSMQEALAKLTPAFSALQADVAAKDVVIKDLTAKQSASSQDAATLALKAKFPDAPIETLLALPEAAREAQGKILQETFGKLKTASLAIKTGPDAWGNVGGVGPTAEAEDHAQLAAREAAREKAVNSGDLMGTLRVKARDTVEFIHRNFAKR